MLRQRLIHDLVHVRYQNLERSYAVDALAVVEYVFPDGRHYEVLFLDQGVGYVDRQFLRLISLNDLTSAQVSAARRHKDELLERFRREVNSGHLVRDVHGRLLVLGDMIANWTFQAVMLNAHKETIIAEQDCTRVTPFDLPFAERLEFETLSQWQNQLAAHRAVPGDVNAASLEVIYEQFDDDDPRQERERGELRHRLYVHFPAFAEREFRAHEVLLREWAYDENTGLYYPLEQIETED